MENKIKNLAIILLVSTILTGISCLTPDDPEPRTEEKELEELAEMISKLEEEGFDVDTTNLGVYYIVREQGEGPYPQEGDTCFIDYLGYLSNGNLFETSKEYHPPNGIWQFTYRPEDVIPGLVNGISRMNKGAEIEMIIPSDLAYGSSGTNLIPPYTPLIYLSKMHDLRPVDNEDE